MDGRKDDIVCVFSNIFLCDSEINTFREMILAPSEAERKKVLDKLQKVQTEDFYGIFKAMNGKEVTIRLLDAPLHEFLPHNDLELDGFVKYLTAQKKKVSKKDLTAEIEKLSDSVDRKSVV